LFGSRRRKPHAHEASSGARLPSRVQRTAFDYGWATQRRASRSARCQTKDQRRLSEECFEEHRLRLTSVGLCIAVSPSHASGYSHARQALQSRSVEAAQALAVLPRRRRELPPSLVRLRAPPVSRAIGHGSAYAAAQPIAPFSPSLQTPIPLQEAALDPPVWVAPVVQGRVRKAPLVVAATLQDCMNFLARSGPAYTAQDWISRLFVDRSPAAQNR
jgi:hypothetical protein